MLQTLIYGIINGLQYAIIALGISLVFGVMRYLNLSQGSLVIVGAYLSFFLYRFGLDPFLSIPILMVSLFILGAIIFQLMYKNFVRLSEGLRVQKSLLVSFGLMLVLDNLLTLLFTNDERSISPTYSGLSLKICDVYIPQIGFIGGLLSVTTILLLHLFLSRTFFGKSIVAVSQDPEAASLMGINVSRNFMLAFAISVALAAIPAALIGMQSFSATAGITWFNRGIIVVILGGLGSIYGVFPAGLFLGIMEALSAHFMGEPYRELTGLIVFVLALILLPNHFTRRN